MYATPNCNDHTKAFQQKHVSTGRPHKGCVDLDDKAPGPSVGQCLASDTGRIAPHVPSIMTYIYLVVIVVHYP
jgi:hypothetical protein